MEGYQNSEADTQDSISFSQPQYQNELIRFERYGSTLKDYNFNMAIYKFMLVDVLSQTGQKSSKQLFVYGTKKLVQYIIKANLKMNGSEIQKQNNLKILTNSIVLNRKYPHESFTQLFKSQETCYQQKLTRANFHLKTTQFIQYFGDLIAHQLKYECKQMKENFTENDYQEWVQQFYYKNLWLKQGQKQLLQIKDMSEGNTDKINFSRNIFLRNPKHIRKINAIKFPLLVLSQKPSILKQELKTKLQRRKL